MSWLYDIGDQWRHILTVVQILPEVRRRRAHCWGGFTCLQTYRGGRNRTGEPAQLSPTACCPCLLPCKQEESTGRAQVLDGAMACPPEDSNGLEGMGPRSYQVRGWQGEDAMLRLLLPACPH